MPNKTICICLIDLSMGWQQYCTHFLWAERQWWMACRQWSESWGGGSPKCLGAEQKQRANSDLISHHVVLGKKKAPLWAPLQHPSFRGEILPDIQPEPLTHAFFQPVTEQQILQLFSLRIQCRLFFLSLHSPPAGWRCCCYALFAMNNISKCWHV